MYEYDIKLSIFRNSDGWHYAIDVDGYRVETSFPHATQEVAVDAGQRTLKDYQDAATTTSRI